MEAVGASDPARCVYVGDRLFDDIWGAQNAGLRAVHVPHSTIPAEQAGTARATRTRRAAARRRAGGRSPLALTCGSAGLCSAQSEGRKSLAAGTLRHTGGGARPASPRIRRARLRTARQPGLSGPCTRRPRGASREFPGTRSSRTAASVRAPTAHRRSPPTVSRRARRRSRRSRAPARSAAALCAAPSTAAGQRVGRARRRGLAAERGDLAGQQVAPAAVRGVRDSTAAKSAGWPRPRGLRAERAEHVDGGVLGRPASPAAPRAALIAAGLGRGAEAGAAAGRRRPTWRPAAGPGCRSRPPPTQSTRCRWARSSRVRSSAARQRRPPGAGARRRRPGRAGCDLVAEGLTVRRVQVGERAGRLPQPREALRHGGAQRAQRRRARPARRRPGSASGSTSAPAGAAGEAPGPGASEGRFRAAAARRQAEQRATPVPSGGW